MRGRRGEDEGDVVLREGVFLPEGASEGIDLSNKLRVRDGVAIGIIDDESGVNAGSGDGGVEEGKGILREGERLRRRRERHARS